MPRMSLSKFRFSPVLSHIFKNVGFLRFAMEPVANGCFSTTRHSLAETVRDARPSDLEEDELDSPQQFVFKPRLNKKYFVIDCTARRTGKLEWIPMDATYDYVQEIARSKYGDMLHDHDRNVAYYRALEKVIATHKAAGEFVHVLDIGTGTGILAMMAASLGADRVTACEAFEPIAETARKCIAENGLNERIKLVGKRSTAMSIDDMHSCSKANILVAEVFDTELIGEGALSTFRTALHNLMTDDAVTIPDSAECFVQLISSKKISEYCRFHPTVQFSADCKELNDVMHIPEEVVACAGLNTVWDVQFSDLLRNFSAHDVQILPSNPLSCGEFEFSNCNAACFQNGYDRQLSSKVAVSDHPAAIDGLLFWWVLYMDKERMLTIDTRPKLFAEEEQQPVEQLSGLKPWYWRDHWIQGIYMLPKPVVLNPPHHATLCSRHDEYSWNFSLVDNNDEHSLIAEEKKIEHSGCTCGWHMRLSATRIAELNDASNNSYWYQLIRNLVQNRRVPVRNLLFVGDFSFLPFIASVCLPADAVVWVLCSDDSQWKMYEQMLLENADMLSNAACAQIQQADSERLPQHFDCCISDVYFNAHGTVGSLPWEHALKLSNMISSNSAVNAALHSEESHLPVHEGDATATSRATAAVLPRFAVIYAMPVRFDHLHKNRAPVGNISGFNLTAFDNLIDRAIEECDDAVEPYRLCEYPAKCVVKPQPLVCIDLLPQSTNYAAECFAKQHGCPFLAGGSATVTDCTTQFVISDLTDAVDEVNGLTFWTDYYGDLSPMETGAGDAGNSATFIGSTGYATDDAGGKNFTGSVLVEPGKYVKWNRFRSQGVYLLPISIPLHPRKANSGNDCALGGENTVLNVSVQLDLENVYLSVKNVCLA